MYLLWCAVQAGKQFVGVLPVVSGHRAWPLILVAPDPDLNVRNGRKQTLRAALAQQMDTISVRGIPAACLISFETDKADLIAANCFTSVPPSIECSI